MTSTNKELRMKQVKKHKEKLLDEQQQHFCLLFYTEGELTVFYRENKIYLEKNIPVNPFFCSVVVFGECKRKYDMI